MTNLANATNDRGELVRAAITKAQTEAAQGYRIEDNEKFHSKEIYFTGIPSQSTRDALKALKFRWHGQKKCWYGFATDEEIRTACGDVLVLPPDKIEEPGTIYEGWTGGNAHKWSNDQELKKYLLADLKKIGVKASIRFNRAGYLTSLTMTITMTDKDIKPFDKWAENYNIFKKGLCGWVSYEDEDGRITDILADQLYNLETEDPEQYKKIIASSMKVGYERELRHLSTSMCYFGGDFDILTESGNNILKSAHAVVSSYNHDQSNSMIDYFDRSIYDHYSIKIA